MERIPEVDVSNASRINVPILLLVMAGILLLGFGIWLVQRLDGSRAQTSKPEEALVAEPLIINSPLSYRIEAPDRLIIYWQSSSHRLGSPYSQYRIMTVTADGHTTFHGGSSHTSRRMMEHSVSYSISQELPTAVSEKAIRFGAVVIVHTLLVNVEDFLDERGIPIHRIMRPKHLLDSRVDMIVIPPQGTQH